MKRKFYRELWSLRFNKMLGLEKNAVTEYKALLEQCKRLPEAQAMVPNLERLIADETRHARLVEELLAILERQPQ